MPIIIAHEETCDIIVNGPTAERPYKALLNTMMMPVARPCTCGGVQFEVGKTWDGWDIRRVQPHRDIEPVDDTFGIDLARLILEAKQSDA